MTKSLSGVLLSVAAALSMGYAGGAAAQAAWVFDGALGASGCGITTPGATATTSNCTLASSAGVSVSASAWSNTGSGGAYAQAQLADFGSNGFGAYSGAGEGSAGSTVGGVAYDNQHAFDSLTTGCTTKDSGNVTTNAGCGGSQELMLLNFGAKIDLTSVGLGFCGGNPNECDISILRWDGAAKPTTYAGAGGLAGWTLVSSQNMSTNTNTTTTSAGVTPPYLSTGTLGNQVSSWWMISTYFGATSGNLDAGNDRFKVLTVAGNVCSSATSSSSVNGSTISSVSGGVGSCSGTTTGGGGGVPEPGSLVLAGLALCGVYAARRRPPMIHLALT